MNLQKYQELTGKTLSEEEKPIVKSQIKRSLRTLENLLGFTLDPNKTNTNIYNELGKAQNDLFWSYPDVDISNLLPPDDVIGAYRLFNFNDADKFLHVDPFLAVHSVKLVRVRMGYPDEQGITYETLTEEEARPQYGRDGIGKYIERIRPFWWRWDFHRDHVQVAVDADWLWQECLPSELEWMIVEMVEAATDPKNNIRSESIEGHSYSKYDKVVPEAQPQNAAFLKRYAGPYGVAPKVPTL